MTTLGSPGRNSNKAAIVIQLLHTAIAVVIQLLHTAIAIVIQPLHTAIAVVIQPLHTAIAVVIQPLHTAVAIVIPTYAIAIRNKQAVIGRLPFWALSTFYGTGGVSSKVPI